MEIGFELAKWVNVIKKNKFWGEYKNANYDHISICDIQGNLWFRPIWSIDMSGSRYDFN